MGELLRVLFALGVTASCAYLCLWHTEQWRCFTRCIIVWARVSALMFALLSTFLVGSQLSHVVHIPSWEAMRLAVSQGATSRLPAQSVSVSGGSSLSVLGSPSLSASFVDVVLARHHSPAAGTGDVLYALSREYNIDDAFALAVFWHESNFGKNGEAVVTHSLGNLRCYSGVTCIDRDRGGYADFPDWPTGYRAWYALIAGPVYVGSGYTTVAAILPIYAPSADNNNEQAYIANVTRVVTRLRSGLLDP